MEELMFQGAKIRNLQSVPGWLWWCIFVESPSRATFCLASFGKASLIKEGFGSITPLQGLFNFRFSFHRATPCAKVFRPFRPEKFPSTNLVVLLWSKATSSTKKTINHFFPTASKKCCNFSNTSLANGSICPAHPKNHGARDESQE